MDTRTTMPLIRLRLVTLYVVSVIFALSSACKLNEDQKKRADGNSANVSAAKSQDDRKSNKPRPDRSKSNDDDQGDQSAQQKTATNTATQTSTSTATMTGVTTATVQSTSTDLSALTSKLGEIVMAYLSGDKLKFYSLMKDFVLSGGLQTLKEQYNNGALNGVASRSVLAEIIDEADAVERKHNERSQWSDPSADAAE